MLAGQLRLLKLDLESGELTNVHGETLRQSIFVVYFFDRALTILQDTT